MDTQVFIGLGLGPKTSKGCKFCLLCAYKDPGKPKPFPALEPVLRGEREDWEDWHKLALTHTSPCKEFEHMLVPIDTFTGWTTSFPAHTEKATEVVRVFLKKTLPRFGLPLFLQSDNGPSLSFQIIQGLAKSLGIKCHLHSTWQTQSSGKVPRVNQMLKWALAKPWRETSESWLQLLQITSMRVCSMPQRGLSLGPFQKAMCILW